MVDPNAPIEVNLDSGEPLELKTGQVVALPEIEKISMGLGWDTRMDVDSSIIMVNKNGGLVDQIWFK